MTYYKLNKTINDCSSGHRKQRKEEKINDNGREVKKRGATYLELDKQCDLPIDRILYEDCNASC